MTSPFLSVKAVGALLAACFVLALSFWLFKGEETASEVNSQTTPEEYAEIIDELQTRVAELETEVGRSQELLKLDRESRAQLTLLINNLEAENAKLKEDLAFFEGFAPVNVAGGIEMRRLQVIKDSVPNQYRYRVLLLQDQRKPSVSLDVQVLVTVVTNNQAEVLVLPSPEQAEEPAFKVLLKRYARVQGLFKIPNDAKVDTVEIRLLESGAIRSQKTVKL